MAADAMASSIDGLHHLVVELVLLRVPSPASLVRAAAVCKLWSRVVADAGFLRLHRSLHTPAAAVAGYFFNRLRFSPVRRIRSTRPSFVPSQTTTAPPDINARHFSLDFLPGFPDEDWQVLDSRGSLLLMKDDATARSGPAGFPDMLVVCDPLARRYTRTPPPPDLLGAGRQLHGFYFYLVDEAGGGISMSNFRVLCQVHRGGAKRAAVFTFTVDGGGGGGMCSWSDKAIDYITARLLTHASLFGRAGGAWHFLTGDRTVVSLDGHTGEYSSFGLPATEEWPGHLWNRPICITDGHDGEPRIFSAAGDTMKVFARRLSGEWALEKEAVLQEATRGLPGYKPSFFDQPLMIWTCTPGLVTLIALARELWLFSVNLATTEVRPATADTENTMY